MNNKLKDIFIIVAICSFIGVFRSFIVNDVEIIKSQNPQITFIDTALCYEKFTEGKSLFIDARDSVSYFKEHIKSSINIDWASQVESHFELLEFIPKDTSLVIYCSGGNCTLGEELADSLLKAGYKNILLYDDGFPSWKENNYPIGSK